MDVSYLNWAWFLTYVPKILVNLMKRYITLVLCMILWTAPAMSQKKSALDFPLGEKIKFKIYYGWFALGEASMSLADSMIVQGDQTYYHSFIEAKTIGLFSWMAGLQNEYWGYVNTANYKTIVSEKHLDERKGKFDQWNTFDYERMQTDVKIMDYSKDQPKKEISVNLNDMTYDLHGTYLYLRSKLWSGFEKGDAIHLNTYWEDKLYDFGMEYGGIERIKHNGNKYNAHKFYALFPVSATFPKERAVTVWVIEKNGMSIPLAIEAELKIGKVRCELKEYTIQGREYLSTN